MRKPRFSEKIKNEPRDTEAFDRFKEFTEKILQVSKDGAKEAGKDDSCSTEAD